MAYIKIFAVMFVSTMLAPGILHAAQWYTKPEIGADISYDTNPALVVDDPQASWAYSITPRISLGRRTPLSKTSFDIIASYASFSDEVYDDAKELDVTLDHNYQVTQRNTFLLDGGYRQNYLFNNTGIIGQYSQDQLAGDTDVGLANKQVVRNLYTISPKWTWLMTQTSSLAMAYSGSRASYEDAEGTGFVDYRQDGVDVSAGIGMTERLSISMTISASKYTPDEGDYKTEGYQVLAGVTQQFTNTVIASLGVGYNSTRITEGDQETDVAGSVLDLAISKESQLTNYDFTLRRAVDPSGLGQTINNDQLLASLNHKLSPRSSFLLEANIFRSESLQDENSELNRWYYEVSPGYQLALSRQWAVSIAYRYRYQEYDLTNEAARGNTLAIAVSYIPYEVEGVD